MLKQKAINLGLALVFTILLGVNWEFNIEAQRVVQASCPVEVAYDKSGDAYCPYVDESRRAVKVARK